VLDWSYFANTLFDPAASLSGMIERGRGSLWTYETMNFKRLRFWFFVAAAVILQLAITTTVVTILMRS